MTPKREEEEEVDHGYIVDLIAYKASGLLDGDGEMGEKVCKGSETFEEQEERK